MKPKTLPKKPNTTHRLSKFIVTKWVEKKDIRWARDVKIAMVFARQYPEFEFWEGLPKHFTIDNMAAFLTDKAKKYLERQYAQFKLVLPSKEEYKLEQTKVGEDLPHQERKPTTILEFCR